MADQNLLICLIYIMQLINKHSFLILFLTLIQVLGFSQNFEEGYAMLENQEYTEAAEYFGEMLKTYPQDKTANICHGRALGLGEDPVQGLEIFTKLELQYPEDIEVLLNLGEANMWNQYFDKAIQVYSHILSLEPDNFVANLGMANAYSASLMNVDARNFINKALLIEPENKSAKLSKKYILLALSESQKEDLNYESALALLDTVLVDFKNDREALVNKAIVYLWMDEPIEASKIYQVLYDENIDLFEGLIGLSFTSTLLERKNAALDYAEQSLEKAPSFEKDSIQNIRANSNYINCLGIKKEFKKANALVDTLLKDYGDILSYEMAKARLAVWNYKVKDGLQQFEILNEKYPNNFEILMGLAEANRSMKQITEAIEYIDQALVVIPNQPDAERLKEELQSLSNPIFTSSAFRSNDIAKNRNTGIKANFEFGKIDKLRSNIDLNLTGLSNLEPLQEASQYTIAYGLAYQMNYKVKLRASVKPTLAIDGAEFRKSNVLWNFGLDFALNRFNTFTYDYVQEMHNFNVDLLKSGIVINQHRITHHLSSPVGLGLYTQFIRSLQTDNNSKNLVFASLYQIIFEKPLLVGGINYTNMAYVQQRPELYFSPASYQSFEGFVKLNNFNQRRSKIIYNLEFALGTQLSNKVKRESSLRIEAELGYKTSKKSKFLLFYKHSTSAQSTSVGFSWTSIGVKSSLQF